MKKFVENFTQQFEDAKNLIAKIDLQKIKSFRNIIVSGMGGSGIGASIVGEMIHGELKIPYFVNKGYFLPNWADKNSLVIINSYSGNTEETINVLQEASQKNLNIICIASGGNIIEMAKQLNIPYLILPSGIPPRASLGYSIVFLLFVLQSQKLISKKALSQVYKSTLLIQKQQKKIIDYAEKLAGQLFDKIPVLYASDAYDSVLVRLRQQINENGKQLCWHHVIPEMNHNEIVGWRQNDNHLAVLFLRDHEDYMNIQHRIDINKETVKKYTDTVIEIFAMGKNKIEKMMYLIHLGDWLTCFLAEKRNFDSVEVKVIDELKAALVQRRNAQQPV